MPLPSLAAQAGRPTWDEIRRKLADASYERGDYASLPMPIEGHRVSMAKGHEWAKRLDGVRLNDQAWDGYAEKFTEGRHRGEVWKEGDPADEDEKRWKVRNSWWSSRLRVDLLMAWKGDPSDPDFEVALLQDPHPHMWGLAPILNARRITQTIDIALKAYSIDAELAALETLRGLVKDHQFLTYLTVGVFMEMSQRSGVVYLFRRARPTLTMMRTGDGNYQVNTALCLHPLAYYEDSFCGGMVPTDDVIAHLMLMRGDEHLYWKRANQHPIDRWQAGLT